jgi:hypothetical protein
MSTEAEALVWVDRAGDDRTATLAACHRAHIHDRLAGGVELSAHQLLDGVEDREGVYLQLGSMLGCGEAEWRWEVVNGVQVALWRLVEAP